MVIKSYFDRNNTIVFNTSGNTGKNPVTELFYGGDLNNNKLFSRYLLQFDVQKIINLRNDGYYPDLSRLKHTLKMVNTSSFDTSLLGTETSDGKKRTTSFDLNLVEIDQDWDEGIGYDYAAQKYFTISDSELLSDSPSNWFNSKTGVNWSGNTNTLDFSGVTVVATQHFEDGNENLNLDITDLVNSYLTGHTNNGLMLMFDQMLENEINGDLQYVGFFTRHTQTFYEPFVETIYKGVINDDRGKFYLDKNNKLCLYVNVKGEPTNVDNMSTMGVTILDNLGDVFSAYTSSAITNISKGVYSIDLLVPTTDVGCTLFEDIWSGVTINGVNRPDIELDFELKSADEYYKIGSNSTSPKDYTINVSGIKSGENINRGDVRKIRVNARVPYTTNQQEVLDSLEYRLYIKEGSSEFTVIGYQPIESAFNYNYFLLDTESLIPQTYYLDIKSKSNHEVKHIKGVISFIITNQIKL